MKKLFFTPALHIPLIVCAVFFNLILSTSGLYAQINEQVFRTDYSMDPEKKGELSVEIDNISFFKNNEFEGKFLKGYTLPGFWIQGKAVYQPLTNIRLEAGVHALCFWGADRYPNLAYNDIADWKSKNYQMGMRILPFFRGQITLSQNVHIVLGNIYGGATHRLIEPIYNPELNLTADPESGLQVLHNSRWVDVDAWVNWESFIFREDIHQEVFTVGLSTRVKFNDENSRFHVYMPLQGLAQHRGGEIDTIVYNSVQTLMNGAIGAGVLWNTGHKIVKNVNVEVDGVGYYQQAGELWPMDTGTGLYARVSADISDFRVKAAYWSCNDFISMFGSAFYGAVSLSDEGMIFDRPKMVYTGVEYSRKFGKGYALGIDLDVFYHPAMNAFTPEGLIRRSSATSFTAGVYFRLNPSFLIKKF